MAQQINLFEVMPETNQFRRIYGLLIELQEHKLVMKARGEKIGSYLSRAIHSSNKLWV